MHFWANVLILVPAKNNNLKVDKACIHNRVLMDIVFFLNLDVVKFYNTDAMRIQGQCLQANVLAPPWERHCQGPLTHTH